MTMKVQVFDADGNLVDEFDAIEVVCVAGENAQKGEQCSEVIARIVFPRPIALSDGTQLVLSQGAAVKVMTVEEEITHEHQTKGDVVVEVADNVAVETVSTADAQKK